jgi:histone H2A
VPRYPTSWFAKLMNWGSSQDLSTTVDSPMPGATHGSGAATADAPPHPSAARGRNRRVSKSASKRAGLTLPVSRIARAFRTGKYARRLTKGAPVYATAVIEYLTSEILELSGNAARDNKCKRITPRHLVLAIRNDPEIDTFLKDITLVGGGVLPVAPHRSLLPKTRGKKKTSETTTTTVPTEGAEEDTPLPTPEETGGDDANDGGVVAGPDTTNGDGVTTKKKKKKKKKGSSGK